MDDDSADKSESSPVVAAASRDGGIDFDKYSLDQLRELQYSVDAQAFPLNFNKLLKALAQKEMEKDQQGAAGSDVAGRFSARSGIFGWLSAKARRSPLYGAGAIEIRSTDILMRGLQRTWLGVPVESQLRRELSSVRNTVQDDHRLQFEIGRRYWLSERIEFQARTIDGAQHLLAQLPSIHSRHFLERWTAIREFNLRVGAIGNKPWVTAVIVAINFAVFAAMAIAARNIGPFSAPELITWGANLGPLTINGQWWRAFTALFIHFSVAHLLVNMWALWNIGRLTERLFGSGTQAFIYVAAGILASLSSIAWNPSLSSVGASGAIFGIFGAFLAFLIRRRGEIPVVIFRKHWSSTSVFVLFSLINGAIQPGIDNAAHVGGLLAGFGLGLILSRPLDQSSRKQWPVRQSAAATAAFGLAMLATLWQVNGIGAGLSVLEEYFRRHPDYSTGEFRNLQLWNELAQRAQTGTISDAEFSQRFESDILPFWTAQKEKIDKENETLKGPTRDFALLMGEFVNLRWEWADALIGAAKNRDSARLEEAQKLRLQTEVVGARIERLGIRARMEHRPRSLAASSFVARLRRWMGGAGSACVGSPPYYALPLAPTDDKADGPAIKHEFGCRAQTLFLESNFAQLESLMHEYTDRMEDLPDGTSHFDAIVGGLSSLFNYGRLMPEEVFGRTADWRRQIKGTVFGELVEVMAFEDWAYGARGHGSADTVSTQNFALFQHRAEMASAALTEIKQRAASYPLWYDLSMDVAVDLANDKENAKEKLREIFDEGVKVAPNYRPLYRDMLRGLMPRWFGSYEEVDKFVNGIYSKTAPVRGYERYTELYSMYARMEGDEVELFRDTPAFWSGIRTGFVGLVKRFPKSDYILNDFANFACRAADKEEYDRLRAVIDKRYSATAWSTKYTRESCDKELKVSGGSQALPNSNEVAERVESLGGIRIGMTRDELLAAKGPPVRREETYWVYNTIDSRHNGVVTAVFSPSEGTSQGTVLAVAYNGDQASAPSELPFLIDDNVVEVLEIYGPQISGHLALHADTTYTFRNGLYINSRDEKVYRYGIFKVPATLRR
jgi:rhomboid protease GluP